jgi:hypothetical protein
MAIANPNYYSENVSDPTHFKNISGSSGYLARVSNLIEIRRFPTAQSERRRLFVNNFKNRISQLRTCRESGIFLSIIFQLCIGLINSHDLYINPHVDPLDNGKFQLIFENSSYYFSLELLDEYTLSLYLEDKLKNIDIMEKDVEINEASIVLIADSLQQYFPECQTS